MFVAETDRKGSTYRQTGKNYGQPTQATGQFQSSMSSKKGLCRPFPVGVKRSNRLKFTPDGKRALISDLTNGDLIVIDAAGRKQLKSRSYS